MVVLLMVQFLGYTLVDLPSYIHNIMYWDIDGKFTRYDDLKRRHSLRYYHLVIFTKMQKRHKSNKPAAS